MRSLVAALVFAAAPALAQDSQPLPPPPPEPSVAPQSPPQVSPPAPAPVSFVSEEDLPRSFVGLFAAATWLPSVAVGNLSQLVPGVTAGGLGIDTRLGIGGGLSIGLGGTWTGFGTRLERSTYTFVGGAVTGPSWRFFDTFQLLGTVNYHLPVKRSSLVMPYVGLGAGIALDNFEVFAAEVKHEETTKGFVARADVGMLVGAGGSGFGRGFLLALRYSLSTATMQEPKLELPMYVQLVLGSYSGF